MIAFFLYIIKSSVCLIIFYLLFKALLSKETFFRFNRIVLLVGMSICAVLPLIEYKTDKTSFIQAPLMEVEDFLVKEVSQDEIVLVPEFTGTNEVPVLISDLQVEQPVNEPFPITINPVLLFVFIYGAGLLAVSFTLFISFSRVISLILKGKKKKEKDHTIILSHQKISPFSWGKYIVMNESDYDQHPVEIIIHEQIHARKRHSLDLIFSEIFILFHWFNPVIWLLKKELQNIHEYEADMGVINQGIDATEYQLLLVKKAAGARSYAIANSFNHSKIKNRITMMLKRKSTRWARLKILLFLPLAALAVHAFARPEISRLEESLYNSEGTTNLQESIQRLMNFEGEGILAENALTKSGDPQLQDRNVKKEKEFRIEDEDKVLTEEDEKFIAEEVRKINEEVEQITKESHQIFTEEHRQMMEEMQKDLHENLLKDFHKDMSEFNLQFDVNSNIFPVPDEEWMKKMNEFQKSAEKMSIDWTAQNNFSDEKLQERIKEFQKQMQEHQKDWEKNGYVLSEEQQKRIAELQQSKNKVFTEKHQEKMKEFQKKMEEKQKEWAKRERVLSEEQEKRIQEMQKRVEQRVEEMQKRIEEREQRIIERQKSKEQRTVEREKRNQDSQARTLEREKRTEERQKRMEEKQKRSEERLKEKQDKNTDNKA